MKFLRKALLISILFSVCSLSQAALITYEGESYNITSLTGTFSSLESQLTGQPWWGESRIARAWAFAWGDFHSDIRSPNFFYQSNQGYTWWLGNVGQLPGVIGILIPDRPRGAPEPILRNFAVAAKVPTPATFWLFSSVLLGLVLRKRKTF